MSDPTAQEPTMEEILASIRRIISEDDQPPAPEAAAAAPAAVEPPPPSPEPVVHLAPEPEPAPEEDILELNEPAPPIEPVVAPSESHGDLDVFAQSREEPLPAHTPEPVFAAHHEAESDEDGLVSAPAATAVASHFGALAHTIAMPEAGRTLEDVVRALLRPLLKDWLDQHLPGLVEQAVRDEVERISRRRAY